MGSGAQGGRGGGDPAALVAAGILLSRIAGLVRQRVFAHYFGQGEAGDAFNAAFRIPNFLQNLFGEGVLSASFIPVYSRLLAQGDEEGARRVAGVVATLLALATALLALTGRAAAPLLVAVLAPGFEGAQRELTVELVRILFPGIGVLVMSAWCLGILNSHRRFFLSYTAPVAWSAVMIAAMGFAGGFVRSDHLAVVLAWSSVVGAVLQLLVQVPVVRRLARGVRPSLDVSSPGARTVVRTFGPVFVGRGVVQVSGYVDSMLASLLPVGAVTALANAQTLSMLPVSLFGMSVSAAELPAMASVVGEADEVAAVLRGRLEAGLARVAFYIVPSAAAFLVLGDVVAAALFQTGRFGADDARWVWSILAGSAVGLLASTSGRLYASVFYALHDTTTPLRCATARVAAGIALGYAASMHLPGLLGVDPRWGAAFLTAASGMAGWIELLLLRRAVAPRIGLVRADAASLLRLWGTALAAAGAAFVAARALPDPGPVGKAAVVLGLFGVLYLAGTMAVGHPEARALAARATRLVSRR